LKFLFLLDNGLDVDDRHGAEQLLGMQGNNRVQLAIPAGAVKIKFMHKGAL